MTTSATTKRQELGLVVRTVGVADPIDVVREALRAAEGVSVEDSWADDDPEELPAVNRERLAQLAAWAAGEDAKRRLGLPNEWDQSNWFTAAGEERTGTACGTACCIAGKVVIEDGGVPNFEGGSGTSMFTFPESDRPNRTFWAEEYAQEALGLSPSQASRLFLGSNSLETVLQVIADLLDTELLEA